VAALLGAVVFFAFCVLYFFPTDQTVVRLADCAAHDGNVHRRLIANGVIFFASVLAGKKCIESGSHVGVFVFATLLLVATSSLDKFTHNHPVFWIWVFIYVVAPILTPSRC